MKRGETDNVRTKNGEKENERENNMHEQQFTNKQKYKRKILGITFSINK